MRAIQIQKLLDACSTEERAVLERVLDRMQDDKATTFKRWIASQPHPVISESDAVWEIALKSGVPPKMVGLCWRVFKERYMDSTKRYSDWRRVFRTSVRDNWFRLWWHNGQEVVLTTAGEMARSRLKGGVTHE